MQEISILYENLLISEIIDNIYDFVFYKIILNNEGDLKMQAARVNPESTYRQRKTHLSKVPRLNLTNLNLIQNGKSVCEYINVLDYFSSASQGEHLLHKDGIILNALLPKRSFFISNRDEIRENFDKERSDFQELYSLKTLSKLNILGNKIRLGNCGEKVAQAFLNLIKYYPEEIRSIEEVRISDHQKEIDHMFLVLNRDDSALDSDPMNWKAVNNQTDVIIVDPSFNEVFFAKEYQDKLMMYESNDMEYSQEHACDTIKNVYTPYRPDPGRYTVVSYIRFDTKNPNKYFLEYMKYHKDQNPEMLEIKEKEKTLRNQFQSCISQQIRKNQNKTS